MCRKGFSFAGQRFHQLSPFPPPRNEMLASHRSTRCVPPYGLTEDSGLATTEKGRQRDKEEQRKSKENDTYI